MPDAPAPAPVPDGGAAAAAAPDGAPRVWAPGRKLLTVGLIATITLFAFEALAITTVMPLVEDDLGDLWLYGWVFSAFFLGSVLGIVVAGWWSDHAPPARPFAAGLVLFLAGLAIGGAAPSMLVLVLARFLQGLGAGAIPSTAYVCIARGFPERLRPRMFALLSTSWVVPSVAGPGLAGSVGDAFGWRWVFLGLIPLVVVFGLLALVAISSLLHEPAAEGTGKTVPMGRALQVTVGAALLVAGLNADHLLLGVVLAAGGLGLGLPAFLRLTPRGTFRAQPGMPAAVAARGIVTFSFFGAEAFVPFAIAELHHTDVASAGVALTLAGLVWTAGSWVQERTVYRVGPRRLATIGTCTLAVGLVVFVVSLSAGMPIGLSYAGWLLAGGGMGLTFAQHSLVVLGETGKGAEGSGTAALQLSDVLGVAVGAGLTGAVVALGESSGWDAARTLQVAIGITVLSALLAVRVSRRLPTSVPQTSAVAEHVATPAMTAA